MIKQVNYKNKYESSYICDSCLKEIKNDERVALYRVTRKKYDLCKECWKRIRWIIEKHKLKREV